MGNLKKKVVISTIACAFLLPSVLNANLSNFIQNNLGSSITSENSGYYKSQVSGFISRGSARIRWGGGETIRPFSVTAPSFNVGCSGIDMIFGGFSYLNFEYLVEKLKKIASAAPAYAFQMALSTLCKDCQTIMDELEKIANAINSMNFDTCQMTTNWTNKFGKMLSSNTESGQNDSWLSSFAQGMEGTAQTVQKFAKEANAIVNATPDESGETNAAKILKQGSIIQKVIEKGKASFFAQALGEDQYEDILRGVFGDLVAYTEKSTSITNKNMIDPEKVMLIGPTLNTDSFLEALWNKNGENKSIKLKFTAYTITKDENGLYQEPIGKETEVIIDKDIRSLLIEKFKAIVVKIKAKGTLDDDDKNLINAAPLPVADILNIEASTGLNGDAVYEFVALLMVDAFVSELFNEFVTNINTVQGMDPNFSSDHKDDLAKFNAAVSKVQETTRALLAENAQAIIRDNQQVDSIRKIISNFYGVSDIFNYGTGR
ncbi:conjugal transfer protein TraH [Campylobacter sp. TTU-622]|uniref:conjugal transfer protein TraH n=1 Tax=Campylobacter sp. TTU-622 TaxID=2800583 RepID=UPI001905392F|nr:conjugal transfer protein TraH [Campylobacter sp. TTU-622]MBK1973510.1 conjugal transfer protein TraH [Campylobacter sp. TTU-622]